MFINELLNLNAFSFRVDNETRIIGVSHNLSELKSTKNYISASFEYFLSDLFVTSEFSNIIYVDFMIGQIKLCLETRESYLENVVIGDIDLRTGNVFSFEVSIDVLEEKETYLIIKFTNFRKMNKKSEYYESLFGTYHAEFEFVNKLAQFGEFIIDYTVSPYLLYGNDGLPVVLDIPKTADNIYVISDKNDNKYNSVIIRESEFFFRAKMLIDGDLDYMIDQWKHGNKWLKMEAKVIKKNLDGKCILVGGVIYDITNYVEMQDVEYLQSIYDLAISSGGIGIFYYDLNKYTNDFFEANDIYANMLGIEPNTQGYYLFQDFLDSLMDLEDDFRLEESVSALAEKLLSGSIEGTNDDIIKIKNRKSGEIKYLLSSSKIDSRFEDGTPKKFGGIVLDVTERILSEKHSLEFAYRDELTMLGNNRRLIKDMKGRKKGIGLFFDLDNFKKVNDKFGHLMGDKALKLFSDAIKYASSKRKKVFPYRLYGDEFFVFAEGYNLDIIDEFKIEIEAYLKDEKNILNSEIVISASVGYSEYSPGMDIDDFIKEADYSMYKDKIKRKSKQKRS